MYVADGGACAAVQSLASPPPHRHTPHADDAAPLRLGETQHDTDKPINAVSPGRGPCQRGAGACVRSSTP